MLIDLHKHMVFVDSKFLMMSWFLCPHLLPWQPEPQVVRTLCDK